MMKELGEDIVNTTTKTYKVVGITKRPAVNIESYTAPGYTFITYMDDNNVLGNVDVYARYTKEGLKEQYKVTANILGVDEVLYEKINTGINYDDKEELKKCTEEMEKAKYQQVEINSYLIKSETNPLSLGSTGELAIVALIVCGIIVFTSVFCIKNSFDISITEKTKQYGMLRSVGATKKQIRKNVFYEAFILGTIGIPLGILSGFLATYILMIVCNFFLGDMMTDGLKLHFAFSWIAMLFSVVLGIITIYLSAIRTANRAAKISPIDSIRNSGNIKIKSKKIKSPKIINKIFGIGGEISYKNLKRNRKKYRTTVISIVVSTATFIALSLFVDLAFITVKNEINMKEYNVSVVPQHIMDNGDYYDSILESTVLDNIEQCTILRQTGLYISNAKYSEKYKETYLNQDDEGYINIYSVGKDSYEKYIKELGLNYEDVKDKAILMDMNRVSTYDEGKGKQVYEFLREFNYRAGDTINGNLQTIGEESEEDLSKVDENYEENLSEVDEKYEDDSYKRGKKVELKVACVTDKKPFGLNHYGTSMIIVSDELLDSEFDTDNISKTAIALYKSNDSDKLQDDLEQFFEKYNVYIENVNEQAKMMNNLFTLVAIFLYGFIIVISLIGVTNIFNTITTNMELRRQEFAMLKSVGMTKKEFTRMIRLESLFMGVKSLIFGIPLGIGLSYLIYHFLSEESGIAYPVPVKAIIICIAVVFLLITCIMRYSMNKINKQNTIETIRNENI